MPANTEVPSNQVRAIAERGSGGLRHRRSRDVADHGAAHGAHLREDFLGLEGVQHDELELGLAPIEHQPAFRPGVPIQAEGMAEAGSGMEHVIPPASIWQVDEHD